MKAFLIFRILPNFFKEKIGKIAYVFYLVFVYYVTQKKRNRLMNTKNLKVMKTLASGGNGSIYLAVDDNNKKYAVKALKKDDINTKILSIRNERMAGERLKHDHIIHYEGIDIICIYYN